MKTVVITGVSGGIGEVAARLFASRGWSVHGIDRTEGPVAGQLASFASVDVSDDAALGEALARLEGTVLGLDALVNNAAMQLAKPLCDTTVQEWDATMATNVRAVFVAIRQCRPMLRAVGGAIVNVGSVHSVATSPGLAAYASSKGAVHALTRAAALELAGEGIRVNAVLPGAIDTPMLTAGLRGRGATAADGMVRLVARHPLGRVGQPLDVAHAVYFLADGEQSGFITGQTLVVDGGASARLSTE